MSGFVECAQNFPDGIIGASTGTHVLSHLFFHFRSRRQKSDINRFIGSVNPRRLNQRAPDFFKIGFILHFVVRAMERAVRIVRVGHQEKRLTGRVCSFYKVFTQLTVMIRITAASQFILVEAFVPAIALLGLNMVGLAKAGIEIALLSQNLRKYRCFSRDRLKPAKASIMRITSGHDALA